MAQVRHPFIAACVQMRATRDPAVNCDAAIAMVREAVDRGADYVQTPEMTSLVERNRASLLDKVGPQERDPLIAALRQVAREKGVVVHIGSLALKEGDRLANRAVVIDAAGDIAATYDKIHLFDVDLPNGQSWRESSTYAGGHQAVAVALPWALFGVTICYDLRFPLLYRVLAAAGAEVLAAPSCFTKETGEAHWHVLQRARAIETGAFMISAAQGGRHEDGRETFGHSIIVDPWGRVLAEAGTEPGVILAAVDPALAAEARERIPSLRHGRAFELVVAGHVRSPSPSVAAA